MPNLRFSCNFLVALSTSNFAVQFICYVIIFGGGGGVRAMMILVTQWLGEGVGLNYLPQKLLTQSMNVLCSKPVGSIL